MPPNAAAPLLTRSLALLLLGLNFIFHAGTVMAADEARRSFDLPAGDATETLKLYATQAQREFIFPSNPLKGVRTNAVKGEFTPREAIDRLIAHTGLNVVEDATTGILMINYTYGALQARSKTAPLPSETDNRSPTNPSMKQTSAKSRLAAVAAVMGLGLQSIFAQAVDPNVSPKDETTVKLDPFQVNADADVGFVAASSLAGGRISTALKDTPVAYSVITKEFLDAFNLTDIAQAVQWAPNTYFSAGDGSDQGFAQPAAQTGTRSRGFVSGNSVRNFWPYTFTADSFDLDRVDFARGPNAILFGAGSGGGTTNSATKQAVATRDFQEVRLQAGSWQRYRFSADVNRALTQKFAVRVNMMMASGETWRDGEWEERSGVHFAASYQLTPALKIRGEFEYQKTNRLAALTSMTDHISGWDGKTVASGPDAALTAAQLARAGLARFPSEFVSLPGDRGTHVNFQNRLRTVGAAGNANAASTNYLNGSPILTPGFSVRNTPLIDLWNTPAGDRYKPALAGSPYFSIPGREQNSLWSDPSHHLPTYTEYGRDLALYVNYNVGNLYLELAGDKNGAPRIGDNTGKRGLREVLIDIDRTLPSGATNPNFLKPYVDYFPYVSARSDSFTSGRLSVVYHRDTRLGRLQIGGMFGSTEQHYRARSEMYLLPITELAPDARALVDNVERNLYGVYTRNYLSAGEQRYYPAGAKNGRPSAEPGPAVSVVNPVTGVTSNVRPSWIYDTRRSDNQVDDIRKYKYFQAAGNFDLLKNRVVLIGAFRRDFSALASAASKLTGDYPAGWNGRSVMFKPEGARDYNTLTFSPKNAAGAIVGPERPAEVRPRVVVNGTNVGAPQYANDRFIDDYSSPSIKSNVSTYTVGTVLNVTPWLGVYANQSTTFDLNAKRAIRLNGELMAPTSSKGKDAGVRVTLPNGKLAISLGWFDAFQEGSTIAIENGFPEAYNAIADAPVIGDLSPAGRNARGLKNFPAQVGVWSTVTNQANGYEFEMTANPISGLRLMLNAGYTEAAQQDAFPDVLDYFPAVDPLARQVLADAGVLINAQKQAFIDPALDDPTKINQLKVQAAVDGWNNLQNSVIPTITGRTKAKQKTAQVAPWVGNIAGDYRFQSGILKGLRAGIGINYRGGVVVGNRASDTIVDPNNPTRAIDDPAVDELTSVYTKSYYKGTGSLSYTLKLKEGRRFLPRSVQFDLNVDNLFGRKEPVNALASYNNTTSTWLVPRNGTVSDPARVTMPASFYYLTPRSWSLSAKMEF